MPNITYKSCFYYLFIHYPQKGCNFHMQVFQIKLKYHCQSNCKNSHVVQYNKSNGTCNSITACGISYKKQFLISTSIRIPEETCHRNCHCTFCRSHLRQMDKQRITRSIFIDLKKVLRFISLTTIVYCIKQNIMELEGKVV